MMGRRQKLSGDGWDVVHPWRRRIYCYLQRAGAAKAVKRRLNRAERRLGKLEAKAS